ncbi:MAG: FliH/SctL family protein [Rhodospirillales bacterium]|nr:FliH/SctL family protein [Rhodospirillales bacterium]
MNAVNTEEFTKFLFDTTFEEVVKEDPFADKPASIENEQVVEEEEPEEPPVPTFSEEEMAAAREEGFKSGKEEGLKEGLEDSARILSDILKRAGDKISLLIENQSKVGPIAEQTAISVAMAVIKNLFPDLNAKHGTDEVIAIVKESFENLLDEPKVSMRVAMEHREAIASKIEKITENYGFDGKVIVIADENMGTGDCRIEWDSGGAERNTADIWEKIDEVIKRNAPTMEQPVEEVIEQEATAQVPTVVPETTPQEAPIQEPIDQAPSIQEVGQQETMAVDESLEVETVEQEAEVQETEIQEVEVQTETQEKPLQQEETVSELTEEPIPPQAEPQRIEQGEE